MDYENLYNENADFRRYVDRYCGTYGYAAGEALDHALVQEVAGYYIRPDTAGKGGQHGGGKAAAGDLGNGIPV